MPTLSKELRRTLENVVADARRIAEGGAEQALRQLAVHHSESWPAMTIKEKALREKLRAHGRQLGDRREIKRTQAIARLKQACAYEHWHRMLFARFLAENNLLIHPDYGEPISLEEVRELARAQNADWLSVAASFAQTMLLEVFRPDDPVLELILPPENRQKLEEKLAALPIEVFTADDSLGWVYQFWQSNEKEAVNKSEVKIGANELAAVTQLFTEDYMVFFLLHNTLGAWWAAKRQAEGLDPSLPGYEWTYLRSEKDGMPAVSTYHAWPKDTRELRLLDPCMGSGHFLAFALPILARMRMEEGLSRQQAIIAVLSDNIFGVELDARCSQIAAFNLALTAWRFAGRHFQIPQMNLACAGLGIHADEEEWSKLAGSDPRRQDWMLRLYALFKQAPTLGSLVDPARVAGPIFRRELEDVWPLLEEALAVDRRSEESREMAVAAKGLLDAARILAGDFHLVITNVPYLGRGKHDETLAAFCDINYSDAKADLATCFLDRSLRFSRSGGATAIVIKHELLFQPRYRALRERLLRSATWSCVVRLGEHAFDSPAAAGAFAALLILETLPPGDEHEFLGIDVADLTSAEEKAVQLLSIESARFMQALQFKNADSRVVFETSSGSGLLKDYAKYYNGIQTGDYSRFGRTFWEMPNLPSDWAFQQSTVIETQEYGGLEHVLLWQDGRGELYDYVSERLGQAQVGSWLRGREAWGKAGIAVSAMRDLNVALYQGTLFDDNTVVIIPDDESYLPAIWSFCSSPQFNREVRKLVQNLKVRGPLVDVPFDRVYWESIAGSEYPDGLPAPISRDLTQWPFNGLPMGCDAPLQVALARLLGYRWPRQTGSNVPRCDPILSDSLDRHVEADGLVCLGSLGGEPPAAERLRALLADAYGAKWSAAALADLVGDAESLEEWLRDRFFEEHCEIFHQRPFIWHIWDGRKDGFHAFVNYHKLAEANNSGKIALEKLVYTALGDWISRQRAEVITGLDGADARLAAALHLQSELEKILEGESPYDIFVRWKPLYNQPSGWEPDLNDGVRLNLRPWLTSTLAAHTKPKRGSCILRVTPKINYGKDRGKEPARDKTDFPWFADSTDRNNDIHLSLDEKREARSRRKK